MHVIGLTGGIASGKSTVARFFREHEVSVLDADVLGHRTYDRRVLGAKVFGKPEELKRLTDIVWPGIRRLASEALSELETAGNTLAVLEAAVLFEAGWEDLTDEIWVVVVEPDLAVERLAARNGLDADAARARIASQLSNAERTSRGSLVIENNSSLEALETRIQAAWEQLQERLRSAAGR